MFFPGDVLQMDLPCDVHAPGTVRRALADVHEGSGWSLEEGVLIASELVTNAVEHSGGSCANRLNIDVGHRGDNLVIAVHDPGLSGEAAKPVEGTSFGPSGRGLKIIEALSVNWGTERPDGYRVWAEISARPMNL